MSISIDPAFDTPERLREYAKKYGAGDSWHFYTGDPQQLKQLSKAFDVWRGSKHSHRPTYFIRSANSKSWKRLDGFVSSSQLVTEYINAFSD